MTVPSQATSGLADMGYPAIANYSGPGSNLPDSLQNLVWDFFDLVFNFNTSATQVPAGGTSPVSVTLDKNQHWCGLSISGFATTVAAPTVAIAAPPFTVLIEDEGSGRKFFNTSEHWMNLVGSAQLPFPLGVGKAIAGGSTLTVTLNNLDGSNAYNAYLTLHGFKIFGINRDGSSPSGGLPAMPY